MGAQVCTDNLPCKNFPPCVRVLQVHAGGPVPVAAHGQSPGHREFKVGVLREVLEPSEIVMTAMETRGLYGNKLLPPDMGRRRNPLN